MAAQVDKSLENGGLLYCADGERKERSAGFFTKAAVMEAKAGSAELISIAWCHSWVVINRPRAKPHIVDPLRRRATQQGHMCPVISSPGGLTDFTILCKQHTFESFFKHVSH